MHDERSLGPAPPVGGEVDRHGTTVFPGKAPCRTNPMRQSGVESQMVSMGSNGRYVVGEGVSTVVL